LADQLHKPVRIHFPKRRVFVRGIDQIWAVDLADMQQFSKENDNYKYLLCVIDVLSKFAWIRALRNKTGLEVASALNDIISTSGRKPKLMWSDKGTEFYNKHVQELVTLYSTQNEEKSCIIERFIRTFKSIMYHYFTANNTYRYIDVLQDMVTHYNNTKHRSIKMTPVQASMPENEARAFLNLYDDVIHDRSELPKPKFSVGDKVRITKMHTVFKKSYLPLWTEELFEISAIQYTNPITYKIKDLNGEEIKGTFYEQELQRSHQEVFRIEKVLKTKGNKIFVKWMGYSDDFNSWIDKKDAIALGVNTP
jgi:hypothetical protein